MNNWMIERLNCLWTWTRKLQNCPQAGVNTMPFWEILHILYGRGGSVPGLSESIIFIAIVSCAILFKVVTAVRATGRRRWQETSQKCHSIPKRRSSSPRTWRWFTILHRTAEIVWWKWFPETHLCSYQRCLFVSSFRFDTWAEYE